MWVLFKKAVQKKPCQVFQNMGEGEWLPAAKRHAQKCSQTLASQRRSCNLKRGRKEQEKTVTILEKKDFFSYSIISLLLSCISAETGAKRH